MFKAFALWRSRIILAIAILCSACMAYYHLAVFVRRAQQTRAAQGLGNGVSFGADFYPIWLTARDGLLSHRDPYSPEMTGQIQTGLFGRPIDARLHAAPINYRAFSYPAFTDILLWPFALLPFGLARIVLAFVLPAVTISSIFLWLRFLRLRASPFTLTLLIFLTLSSYPVLEGLFAEQMGLLAAFLLAASLTALAGQKLFLSGSLLALALIKPQMILLVAAYLLLWSIARWRDRRPFVIGFLSASGTLLIASLLVWPHWIPAWLRVIAGYRQYSTPPLVSYLLGNWIGPRLGPILIAALLISAPVLAWRMRRASPHSFEFAGTICLLLAVTTITILPGHAVYDHVVLLPGIILIALSWRDFAASLPCRGILSASAIALFWPWLAAPLVLATRGMLSRELGSAILMLPIRTAAAIPFGVCALLSLMMRRAIAGRNISRTS